MEKEISKLIELAREYVAFGKEMGFMQDHNRLRGFMGGDRIIVYFDDNYNSASVKFGRIEVCLYSNEITMPFNTTNKDLTKTYEDCANFLNILKTNEKETIGNEMEKKKVDKIQRLRKELELLETQI